MILVRWFSHQTPTDIGSSIAMFAYQRVTLCVATKLPPAAPPPIPAFLPAAAAPSAPHSRSAGGAAHGRGPATRRGPKCSTRYRSTAPWHGDANFGARRLPLQRNNGKHLFSDGLDVSWPCWRYHAISIFHIVFSMVFMWRRAAIRNSASKWHVK